MKTLSATKAVEAIKSAGINMVPYNRGPLGKHNASLAKTPSGDGLKFWLPETAIIQVSTNKKKGQAVLVIEEPSRKVPNKRWDYKEVGERQFPKTYKEWTTDDKNYINDLLRDTDPDNFIPRSRFVVTNAKIGKRDLYGYSPDKITQTGYSATQKTKTYFLIGADEGKHFISVLKNPVNTVEEAHQELRPKGVSDNAIRQGEWFFDPADDKIAVEILAKNKFLRNRRLEGHESYANKSSHEAALLATYKGQKYAIGKVRDRRKGYHKPIVLTKLHRVVRNNEREFKKEPVNYD